MVIAAGLVAASALWARHVNVHLGEAAPLLGSLRPRFSPLTLPALAVAAMAVCTAPALACRLAWRQLMPATWLMAFGWALALAGADGSAGIVGPLRTPDEYLPDLAHVHGLTAYISGFTAHVHDPSAGQFLWSVHVAGGPPGTLLLFALLARADVAGPVWASLLVIAVGAAAVPAGLLTARQLAGEETARRAAPFLAFAPSAVWVATSADALFLGFSAWGIALLAVAADRRSAATRADLLALLGGLLLGAALYCSYGIAPLGLVAVAVVLSRRRVRPLLLGATGVAAVAAGFAALGFWWWSGLTATRIRYAEGIASSRPYGYFLLADLAAFALAVGPAALAGLARLPRGSRLWWPVGATLLAIAAADLSGLSKGEVERIWLPFTTWLLLTTPALHLRKTHRGWLTAQIALGLLLQTSLVSNW
ncbi:MAG TPA: hypothetical protein VJ851_09335 [Jatrophihabitans sp.]|nr:hypothetical protein [Jatrophihabitans sp.]